jgi:hypothetical protein
LLFRRNFAVLDLHAKDGRGWEPHRNLRVRFHAEDLSRPLEQTLLAL